MTGHVTPGTVPAMDRPSIALAKALDGIVVERMDEHDEALVLVCQHCSTVVCDVEPNDTVRVLFNTALAHVCSG